VNLDIKFLFNDKIDVYVISSNICIYLEVYVQCYCLYFSLRVRSLHFVHIGISSFLEFSVCGFSFNDLIYKYIIFYTNTVMLTA